MKLRIPAATALVSLALAAPAAAQVPGPCAGIATDDPLGDNFTLVDVMQTQANLRQNLDLQELYFRRDNKVTSAYVKVRDLQTAVAPDGTSNVWFVVWTDSAGARKFVAATLDATQNPGGALEPLFRFGTLATQFTYEGETTGKFFTGPNGVIRIDIPGALAPLNRALGGPYADARVGRGFQGTGVVSGVDRAPNGTAVGTDFKVADCPPAPSPAA
jgi:hypothetical protein